ncbi:MAG: chromate transporter [Mogibacterium sp.]|nr:chromate transporter [Mogibacterium sp.]
MGELLELFIIFFKLGAFTIGGGIAMLPLLQHSMTVEKKWYSTDEFVDIIAVCQSLPGVVAINMATFVGYKKKGLIGSIVATFGVVLPSFVMILLIATFITNMGDNVYLSGAMAGLRAAALGLIAVSIIQLSSAVFKNKWTVAAAVLSFVLIAVIGINTAYVILLFLLLGVAAAFIGGKGAREAAAAEEREEREEGVSAE